MEKKIVKALLSQAFHSLFFSFESIDQTNMRQWEIMLLFQGDKVFNPAVSKITKTSHPQFRGVTSRAEREGGREGEGSEGGQKWGDRDRAGAGQRKASSCP